MSITDRLKSFTKAIKILATISSGGFFIAYNISQTYEYLCNIVNPNVLDREKKYTQEYIYIDDPSYDLSVKKERDKEKKRPIGFARIWKSLTHSVAWRLLWLCRHGNTEQRNLALQQLVTIKNTKDWDCLKLAQALDKDTAVLLARTKGADLRYFLPPPLHVRKAALSPELLSYKFRDILLILQGQNSHSCIQSFLTKYFANVQEQVVMDSDIIISKPDAMDERELCLLCLDAFHHHFSVFGITDMTQSQLESIIQTGFLSRLPELLLRNRNDIEMDLAVLRVLTVLSVKCSLLTAFFQNGLIGELSRLVRSNDLRIASSAAVCLVNISGECCFKPGLYLLYPIYRTSEVQDCDILLVHGLRGGVFVTWRQRDRSCAEPIGLIESMSMSSKIEPCSESPYLSDPELRQVIEDLMELEDESVLSEFEIILHDLPEKALRENINLRSYFALKKRQTLLQEEEDRSSYTYCWPKDWLPKDFKNLRILGVNYFTSLSDWFESCPLQTANIAKRSATLALTLSDAGLGTRNIPIVWLAHSMGGLLVKQILVDSSESDKRLSKNTRAVLFYSTPHRGSTLATMPRVAAAILWPSADVRQLQENSTMLLELQKSFLKFAEIYNWETISFSETLPTLITAFKVPIHLVESSSADLGRGVFYELPLDHLSICKPATRQSILYTTVVDVLTRATRKPEEPQSHSSCLISCLSQIFANGTWEATDSDEKKMFAD